MRKLISPRLRKPLGIALAGTAFAAAWLIRGGPLWWVAIMSVILTAVRAVSWYVRAGEDSDEGALAGSRADERQQFLSLRSWALAGKLTAVAAFIGLTFTIAVKSAAWWPFLAILAVALFGYLLGLSAYGVAEESLADDANTGHHSPSPVGQ